MSFVYNGILSTKSTYFYSIEVSGISVFGAVPTLMQMVNGVLVNKNQFKAGERTLFNHSQVGIFRLRFKLRYALAV